MTISEIGREIFFSSKLLRFENVLFGDPRVSENRAARVTVQKRVSFDRIIGVGKYSWTSRKVPVVENIQRPLGIRTSIVSFFRHESSRLFGRERKEIGRKKIYRRIEESRPRFRVACRYRTRRTSDKRKTRG